MREWVNLGKSDDTAFHKLRPHAPMKQAHFKAFAAAIGMSNVEATLNWDKVIMPIRNARRLDGKHLSDICTHMLLQPESAIVHSKISRPTLKSLFDGARECLYPVEAVIPCKGKEIECPK